MRCCCSQSRLPPCETCPCRVKASSIIANGICRLIALERTTMRSKWVKPSGNPASTVVKSSIPLRFPQRPLATTMQRSQLSIASSKLDLATLTCEYCKSYRGHHLQFALTNSSSSILIHAPFGGREGREGSWRALVEAQKAGLVRSIGVSNYGIDHLNEWEEYKQKLGGDIDVGQYELHPWCNRDDIVAWLRKRNIVVEAYSPLAQATRWDDPTLQALSKKLNKSPAQILLRWNMQKVGSRFRRHYQYISADN